MIEATKILAELPDVLRRVCRQDMPDIAETMLLREVPGMNSLRALETIALLEEQFGVEIDVAALQNIKSLGDIVTAIASARPA